MLKYERSLCDGDVAVKGEFLVWQQMWLKERKEDRPWWPRNALTAYAKEDAISFHIFRILLQILCTIGCTTAHRLQAQILLSSYRDWQPTADEILDKFVRKKDRGLQLVLKK